MLRKENLQNLLEISARRLQKLKEQQALKGINAPPELLIEIEDLEDKVEQFQAELRKATDYEAAQQDKIYILSSIPGVWNVSDDEALAAHKKLEETLKKVSQPDEIIFPSLSELRHDSIISSEGRANIASIAFVDLSNHGLSILEYIAQARDYLPSIVFILYTSAQEYKRFKAEIPTYEAKRFEHYYKLGKHRALTFESEVREILDAARRTALQKKAAT